MAADDSTRNYYVYVLYHADGITPFYVGMGKDYRIDWHRGPASQRLQSPRGEIIRKTIALCGDVPRRKVAENLTRPECWVIESALIKALGPYPNGLLTNVYDGGKHRSRITPEESLRLTDSRSGLITVEFKEKVSAGLKAAHARRKLKKTSCNSGNAPLP